jgi:hypothetical protein
LEFDIGFLPDVNFFARRQRVRTQDHCLRTSIAVPGDRKDAEGAQASGAPLAIVLGSVAIVAVPSALAAHDNCIWSSSASVRQIFELPPRRHQALEIEMHEQRRVAIDSLICNAPLIVARGLCGERLLPQFKQRRERRRVRVDPVLRSQ